MRCRDNKPTVIKQLEPQGVTVFYPVTPNRVSIFSSPDRQIVKEEYSHLKGHIFIPTQNRAYRRKMRKPFKPNNLRRSTRAMKQGWDEAERLKANG